MIGSRIIFKVDSQVRDYNHDHFGIAATDFYEGTIVRFHIEQNEKSYWPVVRLDTGQEVIGPGPWPYPC